MAPQSTRNAQVLRGHLADMWFSSVKPRINPLGKPDKSPASEGMLKRIHIEASLLGFPLSVMVTPSSSFMDFISRNHV
jgi:hypothetical protein